MTPERIDLAAIKAAAEVAAKPVEAGKVEQYVNTVTRSSTALMLALCDPATLLALVAAAEALERYADRKNYDGDPSALDFDDGELARQALAPFTSRPEAPHG